jgi:Protein of unknown function (DUF642)
MQTLARAPSNGGSSIFAHRVCAIVALGCAVLISAPRGHAQSPAVVNGSFEQDTFSYGGTLGLGCGNTLTGWTTQCSADGEYPWGVPNSNQFGAGPTPYGSQWIVLGDFGMGGSAVWQTVSGFKNGNTYRLSFALASEYPGSPGSRLRVSFPSGSSTPSQDFTAPPTVADGWKTWGTFSMTFVATRRDVTIRFDGLADVSPPHAYDPGLDNVSITLVGTDPTIVWGTDTGGGANCGGTNVANTNQSVVVGQQIAFTACFNPPAGATITSEAWSPSPTVPSGTVVSGYNASTTAGCVVAFGNFGQTGCPSPSPPASTGAVCGTSNYCDFPTFYWVDTGGNNSTLTIQYTYALNGATYSGSASLNFSVTGPTGVTGSAQIGGPTVLPMGSGTNAAVVTPGGTPTLFLGGIEVPTTYFLPSNGQFVAPHQQVGVIFTASATHPPGNQGSFLWVQLVDSYWLHVLKAPPGSMELCPGVGPPVRPGAAAEIDNAYPFSDVLWSSQSPPIPNDIAYDRPGVALNLATWPPGTTALGEVSLPFSATTYVMWEPNADGACTGGSQCTIPVPLGYFSSQAGNPLDNQNLPYWNFGCDAINTLQAQQQGQNTTTLTLLQTCGANPLAPGFASSNAYPTWSAAFSNNGGVGCPSQ